MQTWRSVRYPWNAAVGSGGRPARFYARLINDALRFGLPARRWPGGAWAWVARRGLPDAVIAGFVAGAPRRHRADLDRSMSTIHEGWHYLAAACPDLPPAPGPLTGLALERSVGLTLFVFGERPQPLVVAKVAGARADGVWAEAKALQEARGAAVAPRPLGRLDGLYVQEGLVGRPLHIAPLTPEGGARLTWPSAFGELANGLADLAGATAKTAFPEEIRASVVRALGADEIDERTRGLVAAAWKDVSGLNRSVLRHHDTSVQNCLFEHGAFAGLVDWEMAVSQGAPGFDMWNAAISYTEYGVGLKRWSEGRAVATFVSAFSGSPFWTHARQAARQTLIAADVPDAVHDSLEVVFFASRVGDRLSPRLAYPIGTSSAASMLRAVCAA